MPKFVNKSPIRGELKKNVVIYSLVCSVLSCCSPKSWSFKMLTASKEADISGRVHLKSLGRFRTYLPKQAI
ncbi:hypothetical protein SAMN05421766_102422 [Zobellia uliginosa]|uniref:Uncharacterized protein n=1 Tax=Zobellia uliginosa TaxID=143224 RepID=A0ABY1KMF6_9FLAO|nr:hypothetical protein SAMN05421766_102422 [Zobellia uliginosa]